MLKPKENKIFAVIITVIVICFFWGFAFLIRNVTENEKDTSWTPYLFFIFFIFIGCALVLLLIYRLISLTNPKVKITVGNESIAIGSTLEVKWEILECASSLKKLIIQLEGTEEATYSSGKHTRTDKNVFLQIPVIETTEHGTMMRGNIEIKIPENTMHSFKADYNKIVWSLKVVCEFPRWFKMKEDYEIIVLPIQG